MADLKLDSLLHFGTSIGAYDSGSRLVIPDLLLCTVQADGSEMHALALRIGLTPGKTLKSVIPTDSLHVRIRGGGNGGAGGSVPNLVLEGDSCVVSLTNIDKVAEFAENAEKSGLVRIILGIVPSDHPIENLTHFADYLNQNKVQSATGKVVASPHVDG